MAESMNSLLSRLNGLIVDDNGDIIIGNWELPEVNEEETDFLNSNISITEGARISNISDWSNPRPAFVEVVSSILEMHRQEVKEKKKLAYQKFKEVESPDQRHPQHQTSHHWSRISIV